MPSGTIAVPANATSILVTGAFGSSYFVDSLSTSWPTEVGASQLAPGSFLVTFNTPAPPVTGGQLAWSIAGTTVALPQTPGTLLAGTIVTNVRAELPDPVYDAANNPLPDADGLQRASTLYGWLNSGVKEASRLLGGVFVDDWTAIAQRGSQPWYLVDPKWRKIQAGFSNQWPIDPITLQEEDAIWPSTRLTTSQSLFGFYRSRGAQLQFALWPVPALTDPATTLVGAITASTPDPIVLASTVNFLAFGYVLIDSEILQYQQLTTGPTGIGVVSRGLAGTTAAAHTNGATVQHLGLWLKGPRQPAEIVNSQSLVELPGDISPILEKYLMARCRGSEEEYDERKRLMDEFTADCKAIKADPTTKPQSWPLRAFGEATVGPLIWGGTVIRP